MNLKTAVSESWGVARFAKSSYGKDMGGSSICQIELR